MNAPQSPRRQSAFTLIELLVVVAIIALLISILLPSLNRARHQARLVVDQANLKQVGTPIALYQNDWNGAVPIVFNYYASGAKKAPARACWLSVAMRDYFPDLVGLENIESKATGLPFDPEENWNAAMRTEYEREIIPDFFVCPFARGDSEEPQNVISTDRFFQYSEWRGRREFYQTFMWESIIRGFYPGNRPWPGEASGSFDTKGKPKYSTISWNYIEKKPGLNQSGQKLPEEATSQLYRKWGNGDLIRMRGNEKVRAGASFAELTAAFCAMGEHNVNVGDRPGVGGKWGRTNVDSHKVGKVGGTNVLMGDMHIEWVEGTRVGWP